MDITKKQLEKLLLETAHKCLAEEPAADAEFQDRTGLGAVEASLWIKRAENKIRDDDLMRRCISVHVKDAVTALEEALECFGNIHFGLKIGETDNRRWIMSAASDMRAILGDLS